jgi:uncharacterized protein (DUF2141 family)
MECPSVNVKIQNIRTLGSCLCDFESEKGFPSKFLKFASMLTQINGKDASFEFSDIKPENMLLP